METADFGEVSEFPFQTKQAAVKFFKRKVKNYRRHLLKVSMCAGGVTMEQCPKWFLDANGKLWDDDLGMEAFNPYR